MIITVAVLLVVTALAYVLYSRWQGRPINDRRMLLLPALVSGYGVLQLTGAAGRGLRIVDVMTIAAGIVVAAGMGVARGMTVTVVTRDGQPWMRYRAATLILWVVTVIARLAVTLVASGLGASVAVSRGPAILISVGVTLFAEGLVVTRRGFSGNGRQWQAQSRQHSLAAR